jgi:mycoredoxin
MSDEVIVYGNPTCPSLPSVRSMLERANVGYEYVNIQSDLQARERVQEINHGYESVPTLVFPDGSTLTEPSRGDLKAKLETLGYEVASPSRKDWLQLTLEHRLIRILAVLLIAVGIVGDRTWLAVIGAAILVLGVLASGLRRRN